MDWTTIIPIAVGGGIAAVSGVVTQLLAMLAGRKADERAMKRETALRQIDKAAAREERRNDFQGATLLALQEALQVMARNAGRAMHFDYMQARQGEQTLLPEGLSEEMFAGEVEVIRLKERLFDESVRDAVSEFYAITRKLSMLSTGYQGLSGEQVESHSLTLLSEMNDAWQAVNTKIGESLRGYLAA